jgi:rhodanese-related sulfurtransferase
LPWFARLIYLSLRLSNFLLLSLSIHQREISYMNKIKNLSALVLSLTLGISLAYAQQGTPVAGAGAGATTPLAQQPWTHKTKQLSRADVDALLANPQKILFLDVRRPDEVVNKGSFPVFLNVQIADLKNNLAYIPKDREIITVSNRAHRAGDAGDLLASNGFKVAGATGTDDYQEQGGTIKKIVPPPKKQ